VCNGPACLVPYRECGRLASSIAKRATRRPDHSAASRGCPRHRACSGHCSAAWPAGVTWSRPIRASGTVIRRFRVQIPLRQHRPVMNQFTGY
jgi:hypothetical protein